MGFEVLSFCMGCLSSDPQDSHSVTSGLLPLLCGVCRAYLTSIATYNLPSALAASQPCLTSSQGLPVQAASCHPSLHRSTTGYGSMQLILIQSPKTHPHCPTHMRDADVQGSKFHPAHKQEEMAAERQRSSPGHQREQMLKQAAKLSTGISGQTPGGTDGS